MSYVRSLNNDAKFDVDVKFGVARVSMLQIAVRTFMGSNVLVPVNQEELKRCSRGRKPTQKKLEYQMSLFEEKR